MILFQKVIQVYVSHLEYMHNRVYFRGYYSYISVILLQPVEYLYLHRLIHQQSPHHQLLVCYCVCNLSANVTLCSVVMLCIIKWCLDSLIVCIHM